MNLTRNEIRLIRHRLSDSKKILLDKQYLVSEHPLREILLLYLSHHESVIMDEEDAVMKDAAIESIDKVMALLMGADNWERYKNNAITTLSAQGDVRPGE